MTKHKIDEAPETIITIYIYIKYVRWFKYEWRNLNIPFSPSMLQINKINSLPACLIICTVPKLGATPSTPPRTKIYAQNSCFFHSIFNSYLTNLWRKNKEENIIPDCSIQTVKHMAKENNNFFLFFFKLRSGYWCSNRISLLE